MATQIFLEHEGFIKARRALIISSVTLLILTQADFQTDFVQIFGLKLGVNPKQIMGWNILAILYFIYLVVVDFPTHKHAYIYNKRSDFLNDLQARLDDITKNIMELYDFDAQAHKDLFLKYLGENGVMTPTKSIEPNENETDDVNAVKIRPEKFALDWEELNRAHVVNTIYQVFEPSLKKTATLLIFRDIVPCVVFAGAAIIVGLLTIF